MLHLDDNCLCDDTTLQLSLKHLKGSFLGTFQVKVFSRQKSNTLEVKPLLQTSLTVQEEIFLN